MFSIWDRQLSKYMETGKNSRTKKEAIDDMKGFLSLDHTKEEVKKVDEEYLNFIGFEIHKHKRNKR